MNQKPLAILLAITMMVALVPPVQAGETINNKFPITIELLSPCTGETITLEGILHDHFHITESNGGFYIKFLDNPQGITGVSDTGVKYQATGETQGEIKFFANGGERFTFVNNFKIIGQGPENNLLVHDNLLIKVNPDGSIDSYHENFYLECR